MTPHEQSAADRLAEAVSAAMKLANGRWDEWGDRAVSVRDALDLALGEYLYSSKEPALPASKNEAAGDVPKWAMDVAKEIELDHQFGRMEPKRILDRAAIIAKHARASASVSPDQSAADKERLDALRNLMGYVADGSDQTVKLFQDDATGTFHITAGKQVFWGTSFRAAIDAAMSRTPNAADKLEDTRDQ